MKAAAEMDRIQKTLEIVRDSVPGEMTADAHMAQSMAIQAIESARGKYRQEQIDKLAEADEERFAELEEHWYSVREDIEHDYEIGMIDQETRERLIGLLDERKEAIIRYRKYTDDYMQVLDKVIQAVKGMKTSCVDDYNAITALWQKPRKKRKPRRVDLRDIRIPADQKHSDELEAALKQVQNCVSVRTIDVDDIYEMVEVIKGEYKGKVPRTALAGTRVIVDMNSQSFAKAYTRNFMPVSTIAEFIFSERQVYLTALYRGRYQDYKYWWHLSEAARAALDAQDK